MNKILKYLLWLPFAVTIGAFALYLRYIIMFKMNSNIVITEEVNNTLNGYLIVGFISLFIGLLIILFKKIINLTHNNMIDKKEIDISSSTDQDFINAIEGNSGVIEHEEESNFMRDIKSDNIITIKLDRNTNNSMVSGKIVGTNKNVNILLSNDDMNIISNNNIKQQKQCPKCNNILDIDAIICTNCGILLDRSILDVFNKKEFDEIRSKRKLPFVNFLINFIVILLCIFLIFLISNKIINQREENYNKMNIDITEKK